MPTVVIDGVTYAPVGTERPRIGVAITTHNRPDVLRRAVSAWEKHLPDGAEMVIVDDASDKPVDGATFRFEKNAGIARAKNKCLELLYDRGCQHIFLLDDDAWPVDDDWWRPYVESPEPHLMYMWGEPVYRDEHIAGHMRPTGCVLYVERRVLDVVGGMDPRFGLWGLEHESWSDRIYNAGLTRMRYQDVADSTGLFYSCDERERIASSVPEQVRLASDPQLAERLRDTAAYVPFREPRPEPAPDAITLSVLIPSLASRWDGFAQRIQEQIYTQHAALPVQDQVRVEIILLSDTKAMPLGDKRNAMVEMAHGDYVAFVDDDDRIEPDYLPAILSAIDESHPDVVTFKAAVSLDGGPQRPCVYSLRFDADRDTPAEYQRLPNHLCATRRDLVLRTRFPSTRIGEDKDYATRLRPLLHTEHAIDRVLYDYDYSRETTETQLADRYRHLIVQRSRPPMVDVVILARSDTDELAAMTQHTIDTLRAGTTQPVNVVVIEQVAGVRHRDAITVHQPGEFAYNAFANTGAATGSAPWIMVANNDLEFGDGWLEALLAARHDVVSPVNPGDTRQAGITKAEAGRTNGRHFSGWCFMVKRTLWEKIGGFDEDFRFWCADDSVIEQVCAAGVQPMIVPDALVRHLTSRTHRTTTDPDESLTWGQVARFEEKYGVRKFESDPRYAAWKRLHQKVAA